MAVPAPWTPDEISTARSMWDAGKSATLIAKAVGRSRNAVIGLAHRQKFPPRVTSKRISPKSGKAISSLTCRTARTAKPRGAGNKSSSRTRANAGAVVPPITPAAPAPFKPRWPVQFIEATGCQWPVQSGPIETGRHMTMLVCDNPIEPRGTFRRYCKFHAEYQHVKQNGEALEYA